jgi:hypothetical protein
LKQLSNGKIKPFEAQEEFKKVSSAFTFLSKLPFCPHERIKIITLLLKIK